MTILRFILCTSLLMSSTSGWCLDQRLKVEGIWDGRTFQVNRLKERDPDKDVRRIRIAGVVSDISHADRTIEIGPVRLGWLSTQETYFAYIRVGDAMSINAQQTSNDSFVVIDAEKTEVDTDDAVELIGAVTGFSSGDEWTDLYVAGIPARTPRRLYSNGRLRIQRLDDKRPEDQFTTSIGGVRTTIGGEFGVKMDADGDRDLDHDDSDAQVEAEAELQLESLFEFSDGFFGYAEIRAQQSNEYDVSRGRNRGEFELDRGEFWIYIDQPFGLPAGIQVGRQNFAENREWWWDADLDAIRLYVSYPNFNFEVAFAEELARESLNGDRGFAQDRDISRVLAKGQMRLNSAISVEAFLLRQNDHSSEFIVNEVLSTTQEDEDDAKLTWVGVRLSGDVELGFGPETEYWFDIARVSGTETRYDFEDIGDGQLVVESKTERDRSGTAFDVGASLTWPHKSIAIFSQPTITVSYAVGSGGDDADGTFRQTGLQDNNNKFNGVDRFRYYGELVRPDLENLHVSTLSFGAQFGEDSSAELIFHNYTLDHLSATHPLRLDVDANLQSKDLGQELDFVLGIEKWEHFEFEAVAAYFLPGAAFNNRDEAWLVALKLDYNF